MNLPNNYMARSTRSAGLLAGGLLGIVLLASSLGPTPIFNGGNRVTSPALTTDLVPSPDPSKSYAVATTNLNLLEDMELRGKMDQAVVMHEGGIALSSEGASLVEIGRDKDGDDTVVGSQSRRFAGRGKVKGSKAKSSSSSQGIVSSTKSAKSFSSDSNPYPTLSNSDHHPPGRRNNIRKKWREKRMEDRKKKGKDKRKSGNHFRKKWREKRTEDRKKKEKDKKKAERCERWRRRPKRYCKKETPAPVFPTKQPSTARPSPSPTIRSSTAPSGAPSTSMPSVRPSLRPSDTSSRPPTSSPSTASSNEPSVSIHPSFWPSSEPSTSSQPSHHTSSEPSTSSHPSEASSMAPSVSAMPSILPSSNPSYHPGNTANVPASNVDARGSVVTTSTSGRNRAPRGPVGRESSAHVSNHRCIPILDCPIDRNDVGCICKSISTSALVTDVTIDQIMKDVVRDR